MATAICELAPLEGAGAPRWDRLVSAVTLMNSIAEETTGGPDVDLTPTQAVALMQDPYATWRMLLAHDDADLVGYALLVKDHQQTSGWVDVGVRRTHRRQRLGTRLAEEIIAIADAEGADTLHALSNHTDIDQGPRLDASTGSGSVPADAAGTRFVRGLGFGLGQVERTSTLELPMPADRLDAVAETFRPAPDYELLDWIGPVPDDLVDQYARMRTVASTAVPSGDLAEQPEVWDAERVRSRDRRHQQAGNVLITTAARHRPSGALVGFSNLAYPEVATGQAVGQGYTMVVEEHRGHSLGLRVKINNLRLLAAREHGAPRIVTGNADENDAMLAINQVLGFRPAWVTGKWERSVAG